MLNLDLSPIFRLVLHNSEQLLALTLVLFLSGSCRAWCLACGGATKQPYVVFLLVRLVVLIHSLTGIDWALLWPAFLIWGNQASHGRFDTLVVVVIHITLDNGRVLWCGDWETWRLWFVSIWDFLITGLATSTNLKALWNQFHAFVVLWEAVGRRWDLFLWFSSLRGLMSWLLLHRWWCFACDRGSSFTRLGYYTCCRLRRLVAQLGNNLGRWIVFVLVLISIKEFLQISDIISCLLFVASLLILSDGFNLMIIIFLIVVFVFFLALLLFLVVFKSCFYLRCKYIILHLDSV